MKKLLLLAFLLFASLSMAINCPTTSAAAPVAPPAPYQPAGSLCSIGTDPAATLLVPYFEVDSANNLGLDTLVAIVNLSPTYIVAHVVIWNVDSYHILDFNIVLTGYDVVTFSMRDIIVNGNLPNNCCVSSSSAFRTQYVDCNVDGQYWSQSPAGACFASGSSYYDVACYAPLSATALSYLQCALSQMSYDGWTSNYVGYLTIDANITCNGGFPTYGCYMNVNTLDVTNATAVVLNHGIMENSNVLMGDIIYYDYAHSQSDGVSAVHIEAFGENNALAGHSWGMDAADFNAAGIRTFYSKYTWGWLGFPPYDCRETLPLRWAFRYIGNAAFDGGTWVDAWRSHYPGWDYWYISGGPCPYGTLGNIYSVLYDYVHGTMGLHPVYVLCWDEEENTGTGGGNPSGLPGAASAPLLILETQRVPVETPDWPLIAESGWCAVFFDTDLQFDTGFGLSFDQSWLNVRYSALNKYTVGFSGWSYINGCFMVWDDVNKVFVPTANH